MSKRRKDDLDLMDLDRIACKRAAKAIWKAFVWSHAREGGDYWHKVVKRLEALSETPKRAKAEGKQP